MSSSFPNPGDVERFEERLRAGAREFRREPPPDLGERAIARVRAAPSPGRPRAVRAPRYLRGLVAAAALVAAVLLLWRGRERGPAERQAGPSVALVSRELLGAGSRILALPREGEGRLRAEAQNLWLDAARTAEGVVRGLPLPLRAPLERL